MRGHVVHYDSKPLNIFLPLQPNSLPSRSQKNQGRRNGDSDGASKNELVKADGLAHGRFYVKRFDVLPVLF